jgi:hypothetical protein
LPKIPAQAGRPIISEADSVNTTNENRSIRQYLIARTPISDGFRLEIPILRIGRIALR